MGKKNIKKVGRNVKKEIEVREGSSEVKNLLVVSVSVLVFLGLFYLLTTLILDKDNKESTKEETVEVQFNEILVGTSFSMKDEEYYVLYYETDDEDISSDLSNAASNYRSLKKIAIYTVDMSNALNSAFASDNANKDASKAGDLKIAGPTLIKFNNGKISEYIEGLDTIVETLK